MLSFRKRSTTQKLVKIASLIIVSKLIAAKLNCGKYNIKTFKTLDLLKLKIETLKISMKNLMMIKSKNSRNLEVSLLMIY
jgi:hypothetical protein